MGDGRTLGKVLRAGRLAAGLTQDQVAEKVEKAGGELTRRQLYRIESDQADPRVSVVRAIVTAIRLSRGRSGITLADLIGKDGGRRP